ncbi:unnamed protein product [Allacma fusca]|uniref:Fe2OG dioxygenase domain-containing protein n=1 Tax=Allacma fusca TaxID=39272 RepID=A0A8J2PHI2_9HEXA|nr:unnamed protein product [Allacma fusca]
MDLVPNLQVFEALGGALLGAGGRVLLRNGGFIQLDMELERRQAEPVEEGGSNKGGPRGTKKLSRKEHKMMNVIAKQMNVEISQRPSEWAVIWGPSLSTGTPKRDLKKMCDPPPVEIRQYENKMFSAMRFLDPAHAAIAKADLSGRDFAELQTMYVGFLGGEPPLESIEAASPFKVGLPEGLELIPEFISEEEEENILKTLVPEDLNGLGQSLKRRWVRHFGFDFDYDTNNVDTTKPSAYAEFPKCVSPVVERLVEKNIVRKKPEQITLNHYLPGQGIPPHVDTHSPFEEPILSLSLKGSVVMDFRDGIRHSAIILPRRSLLVMKGESRFLWTHGIANRTFDVLLDVDEGVTARPREPRLSLTFRLLKENKVCNCRFPFMCDSQKGKITSENASNLEDNLVHQVYEDIAQHFSSTRHTPWPKIKEFVQNLGQSDVLLDVGCGNGKYLQLRGSCCEVGTDMSTGLLSICRSTKNAEVLKSNCLMLPFKNNTFDAIICIAVLHHLSTKERRLQAVNEIFRTLRPGGQALIYVWAKNQEVDETKSVYAQKQDVKTTSNDLAADSKQDILKNYTFLPVHNRESDFPHNDMLVPWIKGSTDKSEVHHRFYHVFNQGELEDLILEIVPQPSIIDSYYDQGNWCARFQKTHV